MMKAIKGDSLLIGLDWLQGKRPVNHTPLHHELEWVMSMVREKKGSGVEWHLRFNSRVVVRLGDGVGVEASASDVKWSATAKGFGWGRIKGSGVVVC